MTDNRLSEIQKVLKKIVLNVCQKGGAYPTGIPGLTFHRRDPENQEGASIYRPALAFVVQGSKKTVMGDRVYQYSEGDCLLVGVDVPCQFCTVNSTRENPYLGISLDLNPMILAELCNALPLPARSNAVADEALSVGNVGEDTYEALLRLVLLTERPDQIPVLAPMIVRELHYRLLLSDFGAPLRRFNAHQGSSAQIARAVGWLNENFRESLSVSELADYVHMGVSTFHRHFKEVTCMTPLQYQKQLRLHEAKRLMLLERKDATTACFEVGYESPSQFNREYKRAFGEPPHRDTQRERITIS